MESNSQKFKSSVIEWGIGAERRCFLCLTLTGRFLHEKYWKILREEYTYVLTCIGNLSNILDLYCFCELLILFSLHYIMCTPPLLIFKRINLHSISLSLERNFLLKRFYNSRNAINEIFRQNNFSTWQPETELSKFD